LSNSLLLLVMLWVVRHQVFKIAIRKIAPCAPVTRLTFQRPITTTTIRNMSSTDLPKRTRAQTKKDEMEKNDAKQNEKPENKDGDQIETTGDKKDAVSCSQHWEDSVQMEGGQDEYKKFKEADAKAADAEAEDDAGSTETGSQGSEEEQTTVKKRGGGANSRRGANKKQRKTGDGDKGEPQGIAGDKTRVPDKGQKVQWSAPSGIVNGEVVEVLYEEKTIEGQLVKASKEDPHVVVKSDASGEICVHTPDAVYFD
jgi:hypothetical protein